MDVLAAHQLKQGLLLALLQRQANGKGSRVSVTLFEAGVAALTNQASNWLNVGALPQRTGSQHPNIAPYGDVFFTANGKAVMVAAGTQQQFEALCQCLEIPHLTTHHLFVNNQLRVQHRQQLGQALQAAFSQFDFEVLLPRCMNQNVPIAPINNMQEVFAQPMAAAMVLNNSLPNGQVAQTVKTVAFKLTQKS